MPYAFLNEFQWLHEGSFLPRSKMDHATNIMRRSFRVLYTLKKKNPIGGNILSGSLSYLFVRKSADWESGACSRGLNFQNSQIHSEISNSTDHLQICPELFKYIHLLTCLRQLTNGVVFRHDGLQTTSIPRGHGARTRTRGSPETQHIPWVDTRHLLITSGQQLHQQSSARLADASPDDIGFLDDWVMIWLMHTFWMSRACDFEWCT